MSGLCLHILYIGAEYLRCIESLDSLFGWPGIPLDVSLMLSRSTWVKQGALDVFIVAGWWCRYDVPVVEWYVVGCVFLSIRRTHIFLDDIKLPSNRMPGHPNSQPKLSIQRRYSVPMYSTCKHNPFVHYDHMIFIYILINIFYITDFITSIL